MQGVIEDVEWEDQSRELYSLVKSKPSNVSYPQFGGKDDEDFFKFEEELKKAFKKNQVQQGEQAKKLKENLKGLAKRILPSTNDNIDDCLQILRNMFADTANLTKARKSELLGLGPYPKHGSKAPGHVRQQVEWLLKVELLMKDLFDLAAKDTNCYNEVYNMSMLHSVKNFFPLTIHSELNHKLKRHAPVKEQLDVILDHVQTMKEEQQELYKDVGGADTGEGPKVDYSNNSPYRDKVFTLQELDQIDVSSLSDEDFMTFTATYSNEEEFLTNALTMDYFNQLP